MNSRLSQSLLIIVACGLFAINASAQRHAHQIVPITRSFLPPQSSAIQVTKIDARIQIDDQLAVTTLDICLHNPSSRQLESEIVLPVPAGSVLRKFTFQGNKLEATAKILRKDEARKIYESIVAKMRDPALLEFVGTDLIQSSVFPVPARGDQRVQITWEQLLTAEGNRIDYVLPRSEALDYRVPWTFTVKANSSGPGIASLYSPSHELKQKRHDAKHITASGATCSDPGPFQISILRNKTDKLTASLVAYPDPKIGGGYFMILTAPPAPDKATKKSAMAREVTVVIDRSGSMRGEKLDQVREAALQILSGLDDGEAFNIIVYNESVEHFAPRPVIKTGKTMKQAQLYLENLRVSGGTNIHDAVVEALRQKPAGEEFLPLVLFLTDGLPTIGQTSEKAIREAAEKGNPHRRRIFTFGVGVDVNTPLLNRIARDSRATATYVLPKEDVEVKVASVYRRLSGPILADPELESEPGRLTELLPAELPDIFEGEQLVLLGQYRGDDPIKIRLQGRDRKGQRTFKFEFSLDQASTKNAYVSRLWASNKIGVLSEAIRDATADQGMLTTTPTNPNDPKIKELIDEIVFLSREFGILTEYTAFFAREGTDFSKSKDVQSRTSRNFYSRGGTRSGVASVNQEANTKNQIEKKQLNRSNKYWDSSMASVEIANVQQVNDRAFYKRGSQWIDSRLVDKADAVTKPDRVVEIGSSEFTRLVDQLSQENRQGCIALRGQILLQVGGQSVLVR